MRVCGVHWRLCCPTLVCDMALGLGKLLVGSQTAPYPSPNLLCLPLERHFQRLSRTLQAATFLDFLWHNMKLSPLPDATPAL